MQWGCERERFNPGKQISVCRSLLFKGGKGDEATPPSFAAEDLGIGASSALLEALIATKYMQWGMRVGAVYPRQTNTCLPIFYFLPAERATKQRRPLLLLEIRGLMLSARCWKRSLQYGKCSGDANGSGLPTANNYLFPDLLLFTSREDYEAPSPSFVTR